LYFSYNQYIYIYITCILKIILLTILKIIPLWKQKQKINIYRIGDYRRSLGETSAEPIMNIKSKNKKSKQIT
jgi:hypothetical protein